MTHNDDVIGLFLNSSLGRAILVSGYHRFGWAFIWLDQSDRAVTDHRHRGRVLIGQDRRERHRLLIGLCADYFGWLRRLGLIVFFTVTALAPVTGLFVGWIPLAFGILFLVLAWGLWTLKPWAYWTTLVLEGLNILLNLFQLGQPNHSIFGILSGGLLSIIIVIYLLVDRNVREAFRF